jgi:hypothetical protein
VVLLLAEAAVFLFKLPVLLLFPLPLSSMQPLRNSVSIVTTATTANCLNIDFVICALPVNTPK